MLNKLLKIFVFLLIPSIAFGAEYTVSGSDSFTVSDIVYAARAYDHELLITGQSNATLQGQLELISTPNASIYHYYDDSWPDDPYPHGPIENPQTRGEGNCSLGNTILSALPDDDILILNYAWAGAYIAMFANPPEGLDAYTPGINRITALTGTQDADGVVFIQGETDAIYSNTYASYLASLGTVLGKYEADFHTGIPFLVVEIGRSEQGFYGSDPTYDRIREAQRDFALSSGTDNIYLAGVSMEYPVPDEIHWVNSSRTAAGKKIGLAYLFAINKGFNYRGSECMSWESIDSTHTRLRFLHHTGSDFDTITGSSACGIRVMDAGTYSRAISGIARENATQLIITHAEVTGARDVDIGYGKSPTGYADWVHNNSTFLDGGFPVERDSTIPEYSAEATNPSVTITTNSGDNYITTSATTNLAGTSSDNVGVILVKWSNSLTGESGSAKGETSWSITNLPLDSGVNEITITAYDRNLNSSTDTITAILSEADNYTLADTATAIKEISVSASDGYTISDESADNWFYVSAEDGYTIDDKAREKAGNINLKNVILKHIILKNNN